MTDRHTGSTEQTRERPIFDKGREYFMKKGKSFHKQMPKKLCTSILRKKILCSHLITYAEFYSKHPEKKPVALDLAKISEKHA